MDIILLYSEFLNIESEDKTRYMKLSSSSSSVKGWFIDLELKNVTASSEKIKVTKLLIVKKYWFIMLQNIDLFSEASYSNMQHWKTIFWLLYNSMRKNKFIKMRKNKLYEIFNQQ